MWRQRNKEERTIVYLGNITWAPPLILPSCFRFFKAATLDWSWAQKPEEDRFNLAWLALPKWSEAGMLGLSCSLVKWKLYSHHPRQRGRNDCKTGLRQPVSTRDVDAIRWCCQFINIIDRLHKWRPKKYYFVFVLIRPTSLLLRELFFCILPVPKRLVSLVSIKRKEYFFGRHLCNRSMRCFSFTWVIPGIIHTFTYSLWPLKVVTPRNSMTQWSGNRESSCFSFPTVQNSLSWN